MTFIQNNWNALWMFNVQGDVVWVNVVPNVPVVDWVIGLLPLARSMGFIA